MALKKRPVRAMLLCVAIAMISFAAPARAGSEESQFVSKHNATRSSRGIAKMAVRSDLTSVARRHSARMAAKGTIWHNPRLTNEVGGNWTVLGENVGMGPDVNDLYQAFMDSAPHRYNILERRYNQFGVGVVVNDGTIFVTIVFAARKSSASYTRPRARIMHQATPRPVPVTVPVLDVAHPHNVNLLIRLVGMDAPSKAPFSLFLAGADGCRRYSWLQPIIRATWLSTSTTSMIPSNCR